MAQSEQQLPQGARYLVIDRFEGDVAVCETPEQSYLALPRSSLPRGAKQSDWVIQFADGRYQIDDDKTQQRKKEMRTRLDALLKRK